MQSFYSVITPVFRILLLGLVIISLQAFSSDGAASTSFSDPVDAATLGAALATGTATGDDAQYWECSVGDGSLTLHYRLMADGSGVENAAANPQVSSTFQWQAVSANSAVSVVDDSGMKNELSDIRFSDRNSMNLLVAGSVPLACIRQGDQPPNSDAPSAPATDTAFASGSKPTSSISSAVVSEQNRPIASYTFLEKSWVGFPAMLTFTAEVAYSFPDGYTVYCANWDPRYLDPTPDSVGQAIEDCEVKKDKPDGSPNKGFEAGQTIDISFGNISASGNDSGSGSSSRLSGSTLRMTHEGQIAIGKFNAFSVASGGNGAGGGNRRVALVGSYALDGHLITIVSDAGEEHVGFVSWESDGDSKQIDHVYINGEHFWNRKN